MTEGKLKIMIKIGGALFAQGIAPIIKDIKKYSNIHDIIIVHGGGPQITEIGALTGNEAKHYNTPKGMRTRYTDAGQIKNVKYALAGYVNKSIVQELRELGVNAFGFTGLDGGSVIAKRKEKIMIVNEQGKRQILRGEFSGKPESVNLEVLTFLLEKGYTPVIGSMCGSEDGLSLNVDGDRVAIAIANELSVDKYFSLTDVEGIYSNFETKEVISKLDEQGTETLLNSGKVKGGMKKKVFAALQAIRGNIGEFIIYSGQVETPLTDVLENSKGTIISK